MNAGSIDFGQVGDSPPIFAQAAGASIVYAAGQPIANGQGVLVKKESDIRALADLKGKRIALGKGTSAHNVTHHGAGKRRASSVSDITPVYLVACPRARRRSRAAASMLGRCGIRISPSAS